MIHYIQLQEKDKAVFTGISEINNDLLEQLYANMEQYINVPNTYFSLKTSAKKNINQKIRPGKC